MLLLLLLLLLLSPLAFALIQLGQSKLANNTTSLQLIKNTTCL